MFLSRFWLFAAMIVVLTFTPFTVWANSVGFTYSHAVDDANWGAHGDYEKDFDALGTELEGQIQSGDVYRGNIDAAVTFDLMSVGVRLFSENDLKGYELDSLGRENKIGASLVVPVNDLEFSVGIFGKNGSPFAKPSALDTLVPLGFIEDELVALRLGDVYPKDRGLRMKDGSAVGAAITTKFDVSRLEIEAKGLIELLGEGEKVHQLETEISTGGNLLGGFGWNVKANIVAQLYGGVVEYEVGGLSSIDYHW